MIRTYRDNQITELMSRYENERFWQQKVHPWMVGNTLVYGFMIWIAQGGQSQVLTICFYDYLMCKNIENCMVKKGSCSVYNSIPGFHLDPWMNWRIISIQAPKGSICVWVFISWGTPTCTNDIIAKIAEQDVKFSGSWIYVECACKIEWLIR